jgi:hypothetical protein
MRRGRVVREGGIYSYSGVTLGLYSLLMGS